MKYTQLKYDYRYMKRFVVILLFITIVLPNETQKQTKCPSTAEDTNCGIMKLSLYDNENNYRYALYR